MNAQEAVNKLCVHLLGKDWYIVDPVRNEEANDIIVDEIMSKYRAVDESPVDKWRRKHKKCMWCRHCVGHKAITSTCEQASVFECTAKGKYIASIDFPRPFCTLFELKKEKENAGN